MEQQRTVGKSLALAEVYLISPSHNHCHPPPSTQSLLPQTPSSSFFTGCLFSKERATLDIAERPPLVLDRQSVARDFDFCSLRQTENLPSFSLLLPPPSLSSGL